MRHKTVPLKLLTWCCISSANPEGGSSGSRWKGTARCWVSGKSDGEAAGVGGAVTPVGLREIGMGLRGNVRCLG
eukprot:1736073-Rhodomonas_salina.3